MYYKLYLDSVFILQMTSNLYLLYLTGKVLKCTATHRRIWLGAAAGAVMLCMALLVPAGPVRFRFFAGAVLAGMSMFCIVFQIYQGRNIVHGSLIMAGCGFFSGSIMIWILNRFRTILNGRGSMAVTLVSGYLAYRILGKVIESLQRRKESCMRVVSVYVPALGKRIRIEALLDTGNHLTDPVSSAPVSVVSRKLAEEIKSCFRPDKYHAIPFRSIGKNGGILHAYELPELVIEEQGREIHRARVIVAICEAGISEESSYQMILHPRLLED